MEELLKMQLRREGNTLGATLLIYKVIMNVAVFAVMLVVAFVQAFTVALAGTLGTAAGAENEVSIDMEALMETMLSASGWGYLLAVAVGMLILLLWKKPHYIRREICKQGKPMGIGSFFILLCLVMAAQSAAQLWSMGLEWICNQFDLSILELLESSAVDLDSLSMLLYIGLLAPITEELLFRGLMLRTLEPYGKRFAIFASALFFGLFHGNPIQTPYAFLVGLVLGYTAMEYNVVWAMVLHLINNLLLSDTLPRLLAYLPYELPDIVLWGTVIVFTLVSLIGLAVKRRQIVQWFTEEKRTDAWQRKAFYRAPCAVIFTISCLLDIALVIAMLFL